MEQPWPGGRGNGPLRPAPVSAPVKAPAHPTNPAVWSADWLDSHPDSVTVYVCHDSCL